MNLFDEHLFDEEIKLFKFSNEKKKKANESSSHSNSNQDNIFQEQNILDTNNIENSFLIDTNFNEESKSISNKNQNVEIKEYENDKNKLNYNQNHIQFPSGKATLQFNQPQSLISSQPFQMNYNISSNPISSFNSNNPPLKDSDQSIRTVPFFNQSQFMNSNYINLNQNSTFSGQNSLPSLNNPQTAPKNVFPRRKTSPSLRKVKSNSKLSTTKIPFNDALAPTLMTNFSNTPATTKGSFKANAASDTKRLNPTRNVDSALYNSFIYHTNDEDKLFKDALENSNMRFNPAKLGFIPSSFWSDNDMTFSDIVKSFFQRKNNSKCRFPHKLYNALLFTQNDPSLFPLVGVHWIDRTSILIRRKTFARLLGIKSIEGSLFHQQGNFPSHGFVEIDPKIVKMKFPNFDFSVNRIITHSTGVFVYGCTEADIDECKWNSSNK